MLYRYVGSESTIGNTVLRFGRKIDLTAEQARDAILARVALIPEDKAEEIGFTAEDYQGFVDPVARHEAPPDFKRKLSMALLEFHDAREEALKEVTHAHA